MLTACGRTSEQKVTEIRVAFNQNENHPQYRAMKAFGEKFEKETNGRYHVTIYPNGVLGEQGAMAEIYPYRSAADGNCAMFRSGRI